MTFATLTSKGQVTIPKAVRQQLKLSTGDQILFRIEADGTVRLRPALRVKDVAGFLHRPGQKSLTVEEMKEGIALYIRKKWGRR